jgi:hypothetical protein
MFKAMLRQRRQGVRERHAARPAAAEAHQRAAKPNDAKLRELSEYPGSLQIKVNRDFQFHGKAVEAGRKGQYPPAPPSIHGGARRIAHGREPRQAGGRLEDIDLAGGWR